MIPGLYTVMEEIVDTLRTNIDATLYEYKILIGRWEEMRDEYNAQHFIGIFYDEEMSEMSVDSNLISGDVNISIDIVSSNRDRGRGCFDLASIVLQSIHNKRIESHYWQWDGKSKRLGTDESHIGYRMNFKSLFTFDAA